MNEPPPRRAIRYIVATAALAIILGCIILFAGTVSINPLPILWLLGVLCGIAALWLLSVRRRTTSWFVAIVGIGLLSLGMIGVVSLVYVEYLSLFGLLDAGGDAVMTLPWIAGGAQTVFDATINGAAALFRTVFRMFS